MSIRVSASSAPSGSSRARKLRPADERAGQRDALPLAAREDRRPVARLLREADLLERRERERMPLRAGCGRRRARPRHCRARAPTGSSRGSWNMMRRVRPRVAARVLARTRPSVGSSRPTRRRSRVLLPQPLLPTTARNCAGRHDRRSMPSRTRLPPKALGRPFRGRSKAARLRSVGGSGLDAAAVRRPRQLEDGAQSQGDARG